MSSEFNHHAQEVEEGIRLRRVNRRLHRIGWPVTGVLAAGVGLGLYLDSLKKPAEQEVAAPQEAHEVFVNQEALSKAVKRNIVTEGEFELVNPETGQFQKFELSKDIAQPKK